MSELTTFEVHPSDRTRLDVGDDVLGWGVQLPSGLCVVDWNLLVFDEEDRLDNPHQSLYGSFADVEQGTGGEVVLDDDDLLEELARLEHEQWMHWSQYIAANEDIPESLRSRWQENWRPYDDLEDDVQEKDRVWARKVLEIVQP